MTFGRYKTVLIICFRGKYSYFLGIVYYEDVLLSSVKSNIDQYFDLKKN